MSSNFRANLTFAIYQRFGPSYKDKSLAVALGVDRTTVCRLRTQDGLPTSKRLEGLSRYFGILPETWLLPPDAFAAEYRKLNKKPEDEVTPGAISVAMRAINVFRHLWRESFMIHKGQYIAYWKAAGLQKHYVASVLEITRLGVNGMEFELINPYIRDDIAHDEIRTWQYNGVVYPVADYLYFFGEQKESSYELLSMIMTSSPIVPPDILRGCLSGIHVKDGKKQIAVSVSVVLMFVRRPVTDWRREIGERLGKLPTGKVPERVRKLLDPYPGVIIMP